MGISQMRNTASRSTKTSAASSSQPKSSASTKKKNPLIDKEFAEQIRKDYGEEMLNELYGEEGDGIDKDMLGDYGGEIIDETEEVGPQLGRPQEYRGRP